MVSSLVTSKDAMGSFPKIVSSFDFCIALFDTVIVSGDEHFPFGAFPPFSEVEALTQQSIVAQCVDFVRECGGW
jgi:hypothetical protein